jgi:hypothetical protein
MCVGALTKPCNVQRRGQQASQKVTAHTTFHHCSCMFHRGMNIPCEHMEALYTKSLTWFEIKHVDDAYNDWIDGHFAKFFQIKYIMPKIVDVNTLCPCEQLHLDTTLATKGVNQANRPNHRHAARFKGREEGPNHLPQKRVAPLSSFTTSIHELVRKLEMRPPHPSISTL